MTPADAAPDVTAVVVASRGGPPLAATLASLAWTARRCVVDPAAAIRADAWPAGAERWPVSPPPAWVLLLAEGEVASDALARAVTAAVRGERRAYRIAVERHAFGGTVRLAGRPLRLARGAGADVRARLGGEIALAGAERSPALQAAAIVAPVPPLPDEAVAALNAEATMLAALAARAGIRPRFWRLPVGGVVGAGRVLFGRAAVPLGWGRWIAAGLGGYRALLAEAKLWERRQLGVAAAP